MDKEFFKRVKSFFEGFEEIFGGMDEMFGDVEKNLPDGKYTKTSKTEEKDGFKKTTEKMTSKDGSWTVSRTIITNFDFETSQNTSNEEVSELDKLRSELKSAIENQKFERAAELRDRIADLEKK